MITHILFSVLGVAFVVAMFVEMWFGGKRADRARSRRRRLTNGAKSMGREIGLTPRGPAGTVEEIKCPTRGEVPDKDRGGSVGEASSRLTG
jgi:hypothetical protein